MPGEKRLCAIVGFMKQQTAVASFVAVAVVGKKSKIEVLLMLRDVKPMFLLDYELYS
jgi:hypothetical protein